MEFIIKHKKIILIIIVNILATILINIILDNWNSAETNYDKSNISSYDCLITSVKVVNTGDDTETKITFRDPNNTLQTLSIIGDETSKYIEGNTLTVYSEDKHHFELTERGIVDKHIGGLYYLLGASFIGFIAIIISIILCRVKGFIFSLFLVVFSLVYI